MRKTLLQTLNRALGRINATEYAPVTIDSLQRRLSEELDWLDACPGRESLIVILQELAALDAIETEVQLVKIKLDDLANVELSVQTMDSLYPLIEEES